MYVITPSNYLSLNILACSGGFKLLNNFDSSVPIVVQFFYILVLSKLVDYEYHCIGHCLTSEAVRR